ncbi:phage head closure protein [Stenotrophomonas sp. CD2]|nr:phage head closure protein [Stenotrophomonas sp. CD2]
MRGQAPTTGAQTVSWEPLADVWAEVAALSARELVAAKSVDSEVTMRVTIRQRDDVTDKCRVIHRGKILNIHGVLPDPVSGPNTSRSPAARVSTMADGIRFDVSGRTASATRWRR